MYAWLENFLHPKKSDPSSNSVELFQGATWQPYYISDHRIAVCTLCGSYSHTLEDCNWRRQILAIADTVEEKARVIEMHEHNDNSLKLAEADLYELGRALREMVEE